MTLIRVDPRYPGHWDIAQPHLLRALVRGHGDRDWSVQDMYEAAVSGKAALWAAVEDNVIVASALTRETIYPQRRVLEILAMGADEGHEEVWQEALETLKAMAVAHGISAIIGTGRPGWARKLGAEERRVFEISLTGG